jgi:hypothetical protein
MKFYIIQSKKRCWTNKAAREALNVERDSTIKITHGSHSTEVTVRKAPASAARVMRAVHQMTGLFGIAVDRSTLAMLQAKPGDTIQVSNASIATVQRTSNRTVSSRQVETVGHGSRREGGSLKNQIAELSIGQELTVSKSAASSSAYSIAKELGFKVKKVGDTRIKRIS